MGMEASCGNAPGMRRVWRGSCQGGACTRGRSTNHQAPAVPVPCTRTTAKPSPCVCRRVYNAALIGYVLLSWFPSTPRWVTKPLATVCNPYLNLFRGLVPPIRGVPDVSPILAFLALDVRAPSKGEEKAREKEPRALPVPGQGTVRLVLARRRTGALGECAVPRSKRPVKNNGAPCPCAPSSTHPAPMLGAGAHERRRCASCRAASSACCRGWAAAEEGHSPPVTLPTPALCKGAKECTLAWRPGPCPGAWIRPRCRVAAPGHGRFSCMFWRRCQRGRSMAAGRGGRG